MTSQSTILLQFVPRSVNSVVGAAHATTCLPLSLCHEPLEAVHKRFGITSSTTGTIDQRLRSHVHLKRITWLRIPVRRCRTRLPRIGYRTVTVDGKLRIASHPTVWNDYASDCTSSTHHIYFLNPSGKSRTTLFSVVITSRAISILP
jgi:hypothetical protein